MKSLESIQKVFNVFKTLSKVGMVFCIVTASLCVLGALCVFVVSSGGHVFFLFGESLDVYVVGSDYKESLAVMLSTTFILVGEAILLGNSYHYFKKEVNDGTPFTHSGAESIKRLGIRYIYIPIVSIVIATVIFEIFGIDSANDLMDFSNVFSLTTGIILILASLIFNYGAELEEKVKNA